jgi:EAL domain-containing protein (putative c-di-GMP-specific phosphodiesterase class I)
VAAADSKGSTVEGEAAEAVRVVKGAVARGDVLLAYQPVMRSDAPRQIAFHEALIRIVDEERRILPAGAFIDHVETLDLGRELDCIALELGLRALAGSPALRLAINVSVLTLGDARWTWILDAGLAADPTLAERLIIEITERSAFEASAKVIEALAELHRRGVAVALDDFGAGYTALGHLKAMRFDVLKMHGSYFQGIAGDPDNQALVRAVVSIARHFEMLTVAEFIETAEDAACAVSLGIDCLQGYHLGRPTTTPDWAAGPALAVAS